MRVLNHLDVSGKCKGLKLSRTGISLSHLFFADDCLIFFEPSSDSCEHLKKALVSFSHFSGQNINRHKSRITFRPNTPLAFSRRFQDFFNVPISSEPVPYLGLPLEVKANKRDCFKFIVDRAEKALAGCKSDISQAGKLTLIKSVLAG